MSTDEVITWESLESRLKTVVRIKPKERIKLLEWLANHAEHPAQKLKIFYLFVHVQTTMWMDYDDMDVPSLMPIEVWRISVKHMLTMLDILARNPQITFRGDEIDIQLLENYKKGPHFEGKLQVMGDLTSLVVGLDYHFCMALTQTDPDTEEHKKWLLQEPTFYILCQNVIEYLMREGQFHLTAEVARILHTLIYDKTPEMYCALHEKCEENIKNDDLLVRRPVIRRDQDAWMTELRGFVLSYGDKAFQDCVKLCDIYHWAMMNNFSNAIDNMMCFLRVPGKIDYCIQVDFNRALAQLGLCAFRAGCIAEAHTCLSWLYGGGRIDFLLGQALTHLPIDLIGQKPRDGYIQTPHHLHIDLKVLKDVYIICVMLLEFPNMDEVTSQEFVTDVHEDVLIGIRALREGNFIDTIRLIEGLDLWGLLKEGDKLLEFVKIKIREVAFVNHQQLFPIDPNSVEAGKQFGLSKGRRHQLIRQCFFIERECPNTLFQELTERLFFFASNHQKIFEGSIYKFPMRASCDSSSDLARAASLLVWDETLSIPLPVLRLFQFSGSLEA